MWRFAGKSRILKVVKTPYDPDDLQPELRKIFGSVLGFNFYDFDENGKIVEYNEAFGKEAKQNYFSRIYDLAYEICEILKKSRGGDDALSQAGTRAGRQDGLPRNRDRRPHGRPREHRP